MYKATSDMDRLLAICNEYRLPVLEDAAEALGARYKGRYAGTLGDIGCFSFNGNKIMRQVVVLFPAILSI